MGLWNRLKELLGVSEERFPKKVGFEYEFKEVFNFPLDFDKSTLEEITKIILEEFSKVLVEKNLLETNWSTSSWKEASKNFISRINSKLEKFHKFINFEKLYKLLYEEFWWKLYGLTNYKEFAHILSSEELELKNNEKMNENSITNSQDGVYTLSKQFQDFIRYFIWGYHYGVQFKKKEKSWWCSILSDLNDVDDIILIDMDNAGRSLQLLKKENFNFKKTKFIGICGHDLKETKIIKESAEAGNILLYKLNLIQSLEDFDDLEKYLNHFYEKGYHKKYKNAADYALSAFCGAIHRLFSLDVRVWIISSDDGLEWPVKNLTMRGRLSYRIPQDDMIFVLKTKINEEIIPKGKLKNYVNFQSKKIIKKKELEFKQSYFDESEIQKGYFMTDEKLNSKFEQHLGKILSNEINDDVKYLKTRGARIGKNGSILFSNSTSTIKELKEIDLRGGRITDDGIENILKNLPKEHLKTLDLSSCFIADSGTTHIANYFEKSKLRTLDIRWNKVSYFGAVELSKALQKNNTLHTLILKDNKLTYEGVQSLLNTNNTTLNNLDLRKCSQEDVSFLFKEEIKLKGLYHLDINSCNISDGFSNLTKFLISNDHMLTKLILDFNPLGVESANLIQEILEKNTTLVLLSIARTNMNDEAIEYISKGLKKNVSLTQIDLQRNQIGDYGVSLLADILNENQTLYHIGLRRNIIEDLGAISLSKALSKNVSIGVLDLAYNNISGIGISAIGKALKTNFTLQELNLKNNPIGDFGVMEVFQNLNNIQTLHVNECDLKSESLDCLQSCLTSKLTILKISGNRIGKNSMIKDVSKFNDWMPNFSDQFDQSGLLGSLLTQNLAHLDLSTNQLGDDSLNMLLVDSLLNSNNLFHLNLSSNQITPKGASKISKILKENKSIVTLQLSNNELCDEGMNEIMNGLEKNHTLTALNVDSNSISPKGFVSICDFIKSPESVFSIFFACNNKVTDDTLDILVDSISKSDSMIMLNLERNSLLTDEGKFKLLSGCAKVSQNANYLVPFQVYL
eukprot:gene11222-4044_t